MVDSFSTDGTAAIAQTHKVRFVQHQFVNYAAQRNFAQEIATHDWVLHIDADERVTGALAAEIRQLSQSGQLAEYNAYYFAACGSLAGLLVSRAPRNLSADTRDATPSRAQPFHPPL